jgi:hypothetical protein
MDDILKPITKDPKTRKEKWIVSCLVYITFTLRFGRIGIAYGLSRLFFEASKILLTIPCFYDVKTTCTLMCLCVANFTSFLCTPGASVRQDVHQGVVFGILS